ncbi:Stk1 family PASTA domain-containing Ser/Thr kinase [Microbacterium sp. gxy059]|uniref:Stk1 family PASTA domain-containing Ser/Thr kinase n=1 Tax=Microbacterium sp. gxy059 TaxID=2957199 RepID=UPI003D960A6B
MPNRPTTDPLIGRLVDGRYRVRARIARGGMATVYVATDLRLERRVALKVMHHHLSDDSRFQMRFIQEARAAARLSDPNVVGVFDQGQDGDIAYLVMEYLPGLTLRDLLTQQQRLTLSQTITVMDAVLSGLSSAHAAGFIHRDIKPENVLLAEDGRIKIGDFGLARATSANTSTGQQLMGTIAYLAPELVTQGTADARTDIYALGIMLYEMLAGDQPYHGEQPMQIAYQHATEQVPRPSIRNPEVPEQLDELVLWATEREPDERPADAQTMLARLREIERQIDVFPVPVQTVPPLRPAASDVEALETAAQTALLPPEAVADADPTSVLAPTGPIASGSADDNAAALRTATRRRQRRGWWAVAIVLLLALAAGGTGWWFGSGPGSQVPIPDVSGAASFEEAQAALAGAGLEAVDESRHDLDVPEGAVIGTEPGGGSRVDPGAVVTVLVSAGQRPVSVPVLTGGTEDDARAALDDAGILVDDETVGVFVDDAAGSVVDAAILPRAGGDAFGCGGGCDAHEGDGARLTVSHGPLPDVAGTQPDDAAGQLRDAGLEVADEAVEIFDAETEAGSVIRLADRGEDGPWQVGETGTLIVSLGPLPAVAGESADQAVSALLDAGLSVAGERIEQYDDAVPAGSVIGLADREGGGAWRAGDEVTLIVSLGPQPQPVPDVVGMNRDEAVATLEDAGFSTEYSALWNAFPNAWVVVSSTDPAAGEEHVPSETTVRLFLSTTGQI